MPDVASQAPEKRPRRDVALALAVFAAGVRLAVLGLTLLIAHGMGGGAAPGATLGAVADLHDGREFQATAAALGSPTALAELSPVSRRLGPGYPALIRLASALAPPPLAALAVAILGAAVATALLYLLGVPPAGAALFAVLTPSWVVFSATAMSEGPFVALALLGLYAWRRDDGGGALAAGVLFAAAAAVRPVGVVLFAALWAVRLVHDAQSGGASRRAVGLRAAAAAGSFAALAAFWLAACGPAHGPLAQVGTYVRKDLALPFASLAAGFAAPLADPLKTAQNLVVLGLVGAAAVLLARRWRRRDEVSREWLVWLSSQTAFVLLLPSSWVFECLARFLVPTLPAVAAALAPRLPRRRVALALLLGLVTAASAGVSVLWNLRALGVL